MSLSRVLVASDDFNRASLGTDWTQYRPSWSITQIVSSLYIGGNDLLSPQDAGGVRWDGAGTFADDQYSSLELVSLFDAASTGYQIGVVCRVSSDVDGARDLYGLSVTGLLSSGDYSTILYKVVNGTGTTLHSAYVPWTAGDRVELECEGTTIRAMKNGAALGGSFTTTDASLASGKPGVSASGFLAMIGDNWEGGSLLNLVPAPHVMSLYYRTLGVT